MRGRARQHDGPVPARTDVRQGARRAAQRRDRLQMAQPGGRECKAGGARLLFANPRRRRIEIEQRTTRRGPMAVLQLGAGPEAPALTALRAAKSGLSAKQKAATIAADLTAVRDR